MAKINAIGNKTSNLTIDPGASGDSFVQYSVNGVDKYRAGFDDSATEFKLSKGSALGTNDHLVVTQDGEQTLPLQPAFLAYLSTTMVNATGTDATGLVTIPFDTEVFDIGSNYNTSTGVFTAPVAGKYCFSAYCTLDDLPADDRRLFFRVIVDATSFLHHLSNPRYVHVSGVYVTGSDAFYSMDAADEAKVQVSVYDGASDDVDIVGSAATELKTYFSGYLAC